MGIYRATVKGIRIPLARKSSYTLQLTDIIDLRGRTLRVRSLFTGCDFILGGKKSHSLDIKDFNTIKRLIGRDLIEIKNWEPSIKV